MLQHGPGLAYPVGVSKVCFSAEKFGTSFIMIKTDISSNIDRLETAQQRLPAKSPELFEIIMDEISRGKQGDKYSDTKGLLWLKR